MAISQAAIEDLARRGAERGVDLAPGLERVEDRLRRAVEADLALLEATSRHLVDAGGKRLRPMLTLLAGMAGGAEPIEPDLVDAATIVELVHLSTLYHDDVIDAADLRRGAAAAHVKWSNTTAILTGDFLLARASEMSAALGVEVTRIMARTIADLCSGQIREVQGSAEGAAHGMPPVRDDHEHYLAVIREKTASLLASSCRLGALLSGQSPTTLEALTVYGHHLGMSFQLADDVLDVVGRADDSGKQPGTDLREGVRTMPVLHALAAEGEDSRLARLVAEPTEEHVAEALGILRDHDGVEAARQDARDEAERAKLALERLDGADEVVLEGLRHLADHAVDRLA